MNRKELLELALKETGSLAQAIELVRQWDILGQESGTNEGDTNLLGSHIIMPVSKEICDASRKALEALQEAQAIVPAGTKKKTPSTAPKSRKRWTPQESIMAESMFNNGLPIAKVAQTLERTEKAIRDAIRQGRIHPQIDPRNPKLRAAALKATLTRGNELSDYEAAQKIIDEN